MSFGLAFLIILSNALFFWIGIKVGEETHRIEKAEKEIMQDEEDKK